LRSIVIVIAATACVPPKPVAQGPASQKPAVTCHEVSDTGSLFSHTECSPVADDGAIPRPQTTEWGGGVGTGMAASRAVSAPPRASVAAPPKSLTKR
jgi:hypothetical protein